jgi:putative phosphoesterase
MIKKVAAIYDIHGNIVALEAILNEIQTRGVDIIVVGGDLAWGPNPFQVMNTLMSVDGDIRFIRGNADREVAFKYGLEEGLEPVIAEINRWCADQLLDEHINFLKKLPISISLHLEKFGEILFVHGSPRSDEESIRMDTPDSEVIEMIKDVSPEIIVCGHTHVQFDRVVKTKRIINPGSAGLPCKAKGACWAIIGEEVEFIETQYDLDKAAKVIRESGVPYAEEFVSHIVNPPVKGP